MDNLRSGKALDKVEQLMLLRLNKQLIPEIASLCDAEAEINIGALAGKNAVTDKAREAAATATASGAVGASDSSTTQNGPTAV